MNLTAGEIAAATGGELLRGAANARPVRVCIDTRIMQPGDLFVPIRGENFDGEEFVAQALENGAAGVLTSVDRDDSEQSARGFVIKVEDTTKALGALASAWRHRVNPVVIAITGSSGKTTTKDMTAHLCQARLPVLATEGNKNNHIGLPLTLMRLREEHAMAVVEMGMNHRHELTALTAIADPMIGVLTHIGDAHLGNFDNEDELIDAKGELFAAMNVDGTAVINASCPKTARLRKRGAFPHRVFTFSTVEGADVQALNIRPCEPFGYEFTLRLFGEEREVYLPVFGRYQVDNAAAAAAAAYLAGITADEIVERLATFKPGAMRSQVAQIGGIRVVEDCYNASPMATCAAIASFAEMHNAHRRYVLFGDMAELGNFVEEGHRRVGIAAAESKLDGVFCVGSNALWTADEAIRRGAHAMHFLHVDSAVAHLLTVLEEGDALLVKGSRLSRMERASELLRAHFEPARPGVTA